MNSAPKAAMPSGTITFLFTDIEGSTRLWEEQPRAMRVALARHDTLMREAIEQEGGYVFKTVGDAFCAAFPTAAQAVVAALTAQRALYTADWDGVGPLRARMALHTGAAEVRDNDYFGPPLNRVARLLSTGYGGQMLLSLAAQQLVREDLPPGTELKDLGEGGLKDLVRAEHVYQLVAPDLPADFPPLKQLDLRYIEPDESGRAVENPYKGLRAFHEDDAKDFFGREELTARLLQRVAERVDHHRFLAVIGPSGSGKSSVVRAGLAPALKRGTIPGSDRWLVAEMLPGAHPLEELEAVLLGIAVNPPESLLGQLKEDVRGLVRAAKRVLPSDERVELVLIIDQFEEVFTLVEDEQARVHFLESLHVAVRDPRSRLRVVITLRADFFDRPLLYPNPGELIRQRMAVVLPLSADELERAIVRPAQRVGMSVESELVASIIKDVGEQPGSLPLLQYALTELFERRTGRTLTLDAYREMGGVGGALGQRAEEIYSELLPLEQEVARQLFLRLVTLGEGAEDTRRRVRRAELASVAADTQALDRVMNEFGRYRLLTFDRDPVTRGPTVEVAHEALLRTWDRLCGWLEESRNDLRVHRQLMTAAGEWETSGRDGSFLASGARLSHFETLAQSDLALNREEQAYIQASAIERRQQEDIERERQAQELGLQKRAANRLRYLAGALGIFLVVAALLTMFAFSRQAEADDQRREAQNSATLAQSSAATAVANEAEADTQRENALANFDRSEAQRLAAEANILVQTDGSAELIALLALRSIGTQYSAQGEAALDAAAALAYPRQNYVGHTDQVNHLDFSLDGKYVTSGGPDAVVRMWDTQSGKELQRFAGRSSAISPDNKFVVTGGDRDGSVRMWDARTGVELRRFDGPTDATQVDISPDGKRVLAGCRDKTIRQWDAQTGELLGRVITGTAVGLWATMYSPDGRYILTGGEPNIATLWEAETGLEVHRFEGHTDQIYRVAFSPDGKQVLTGSPDKTARLWDAQTGQELRQFAHSVEVYGVAFSPDGKYVLTGAGNTARLWDAQTGDEVQRFTRFIGDVVAVRYSPDGEYVLIASGTGNLVAWDAQPRTELPQLVGHTDLVKDVELSPDGKYVLTGSHDKTARLWDAHTGAEVQKFAGHTSWVMGVAFSPDGKQVLTVSDDKTVRLWDAQTAQQVQTFTGHTGQVLDVAFSPDGKHALTGSFDKTAILWNVGTGKPIHRLANYKDQVISVAFSPDGRYALAGSSDNTARLLDVLTGKEVLSYTGHLGGAGTVGFSPDGKQVLIGSRSEATRMLDVQTGELIREFLGTLGRLSPDGKYVFTITEDNRARVWDAQTGAEVRRLSDPAAEVVGGTFSRDSKQVLTANDLDYTIRLWNVDYHDTVRYLCGTLLRDLTDDERAQFDISDKDPTCR